MRSSSILKRSNAVMLSAPSVSDSIERAVGPPVVMFTNMNPA